MGRNAQRPTPPAARWIVESATPFDQLTMFGPSGFEASARLRFIPDPSCQGQDEADVVLPDDHIPDLVQVQLALRRLAEFTATPQDCYFCVWDGYSDIELPAAAALVVLPHRRYAMFQGPLRQIDTFAEDLGSGRIVAPPAFVWPADHRWCLACDVDPHWAGLGAEQAAVDALIADVDLDVVQAEPDKPQPLYY